MAVAVIDRRQWAREEGMSNKLNADALLQEAFDVLTPHGGGSSDEANRKAALREKIGRYLAEQGKPVAGSGGGRPAMFGGCAAGIYAALGSTSTGSFTVNPGDVATIRIGEGGGASFQIDDAKD